jgi:hypothetical protein
VTTLAELDTELARLPATPITDEDLDARARLTGRRIELIIAAKDVAEAIARPKPRGSLVVYVPENVGISHYYSNTGNRVALSRVTDDGRVVIDLFPAEFKSLLADRQYGLSWESANHEALQLAAVR